jgi:hypothetical protein
MNCLAVGDVVAGSFEVRQFEPAQFANRRVERLAPRATALAAPLATEGAQRAQHLRAVEPLPLTVLAKTHAPSCHGTCSAARVALAPGR